MAAAAVQGEAGVAGRGAGEEAAFDFPPGWRSGPGESKGLRETRGTLLNLRARLLEAPTEQSLRGKPGEEMGTAFGQFPPRGVPGPGPRQPALQQGQGLWARPPVPLALTRQVQAKT